MWFSYTLSYISFTFTNNLTLSLSFQLFHHVSKIVNQNKQAFQEKPFFGTFSKIFSFFHFVSSKKIISWDPEDLSLDIYSWIEDPSAAGIFKMPGGLLILYVVKARLGWLADLMLLNLQA